MRADKCTDEERDRNEHDETNAKPDPASDCLPYLDPACRIAAQQGHRIAADLR